MTPDERALLGAVLADPRDDLPRLVYADWLEENATDEVCFVCDGRRVIDSGGTTPWGDPIDQDCPNCSGTGRVGNGFAERAEFIRVQVELARHPCGDTARREYLGGDCYCASKEPGFHCLPCLDLARKEVALRRRERELWRAVHQQVIPSELHHQLFGNDAAEGRPCEVRNANAGITVSRGFVESVRATTAELFGGECPRCGGAGAVGHEYDRGVLGECDRCSGTGRTAGAAADVFASQPVTEVVLTDREPWTIRHDAFGWYDFAHPGLGASHDESLLPTDLFDLLPLEGRNTDADPRGGRTGRRDYWAWYSSRSLALSALSAACVSLGRSLARGWDHEAGECGRCKGTKAVGCGEYYEETCLCPSCRGSGRARRPGLGPLRTGASPGASDTRRDVP